MVEWSEGEGTSRATIHQVLYQRKGLCWWCFDLVMDVVWSAWCVWCIVLDVGGMDGSVSKNWEVR